MLNFNIFKSDPVIESGRPTGPTRTKVSSAQFKKLSEVNARVSKRVLPTLASLSSAMNAAGRKIFSAILFIPYLSCSTMIKTAKCVLSCLISAFMDLSNKTLREAVTKEEYKRILEVLSRKSKKDMTNPIGEEAIYSRILTVSSTDRNHLEEKILQQLRGDLARCDVADDTDVFMINGARKGIRRDDPQSERTAIANMIVDDLKDRIDRFYRETQPDLPDEERLQKVMRVMDNLHQATYLLVHHKLESFVTNEDLGYQTDMDGTLGSRSIQLNIDPATNTLRVTASFSKNVMTLDDVLERVKIASKNIQHMNEGAGTLEPLPDRSIAKAAGYLTMDFIHPEASTLCYKIEMC